MINVVASKETKSSSDGMINRFKSWICKLFNIQNTSSTKATDDSVAKIVQNSAVPSAPVRKQTFMPDSPKYTRPRSDLGFGRQAQAPKISAERVPLVRRELREFKPNEVYRTSAPAVLRTFSSSPPETHITEPKRRRKLQKKSPTTKSNSRFLSKWL